MDKKKGFTVLELMLCIIFAGILLVLFFMEQGNLASIKRDEQRKVAINAFYYALEEGYYEQNGYYPETIDNESILPWVDPELFTDPLGYTLWSEGSDYTYEASDCDGGKCKGYTLRSDMEKEGDYVKSNRYHNKK